MELCIIKFLKCSLCKLLKCKHLERNCYDACVLSEVCHGECVIKHPKKGGK